MPYSIGSKGYGTDGNFLSTVSQLGVLDTPKTVTFGAGGTTTSGAVSVTASGHVTIVDAGYYSFKQRFRVSRTGASGVSQVFFWAESSADNGATWDVTGNSVVVSLNASIDTTVFFDLANLNLPAGAQLRNRFARSSTGDNSGDLTATTPSATLTGLGVLMAPSAQITIYKLG